MTRFLTHRVLLAAVAGTSLATLVVCGIGVHLTIRQHRNVQGILLQTQERAALDQVRQLQSALAQEEKSALARFLAAQDAGAELGKILEESPFLRDPFSISADGQVRAPHPRRLRAPPASEPTETFPDAYEQATRFALSPAPAADRLAALERVHRSPEVAPPWRISARLHMAALHRRQRDARSAVVLYQSILEEFKTYLQRSSAPSYLHVTLGLAEALSEAGDVPSLTDVVLDALRKLRDGELNPGLDEEEYFLERANTILSRHGTPAPSDLGALRGELSRRRLTLTEAENLRDWLAEQHAGTVRGSAREPQHYFTRFTDRILPVVWTQAPRQERGGLLALGFQIDLDGLKRFFEDRLAAGEHESGWRIDFGAKDAPAGFVGLASFPGDFAFIRLGLDAAAWSSLVSEARRPFVFAGALIAILGLILLAGLGVIFRGVRREYQLSRMKTEFVANVTHELKTPLALIRLCGETLLLRRVRDPQQSDRYLNVITRESVRLSHLIANILNFSSIEAGKKAYQIELRDISSTVRETLEDYRFRLEEKGFTCEADIQPGLPPVLADADAVAQALINLLENAVRYSGDSRTIGVRVGTTSGGVEIAVSDRGVGIAPEDQPKVWEDYYRTKTARALGTRGSGLGLSVVQHIMKAHGGSAELTSEVGKGSTFTLVFPLAPSAPAAADDEDGPSEERGER